jgi:hypothetical protein
MRRNGPSVRIEKIMRVGKEFAILPLDDLKKLMDAAEMLADVKAFDAAKRRLARGEDELIPFEITERRLAGENTISAARRKPETDRQDPPRSAKIRQDKG